MLIWVLIMMFLSAYFNDFKDYNSRALVIIIILLTLLYYLYNSVKIGISNE